MSVFVVTRGERSGPGMRPDPLMAERRSSELQAALSALGVDPLEIRQGAYPDGELSSHVEELASEIEAMVTDLTPDDVCVTHIDEPHDDHAAAAQATRKALSSIATPPRLLEYPIWLWATWPLSRTHGWRTILSVLSLCWRRDLERVQIQSVHKLKTEAMSNYGSQLGKGALPIPIQRRAMQDPELYFVVARGTS